MLQGREGSTSKSERASLDPKEALRSDSRNGVVMGWGGGKEEGHVIKS